MMCIKSCQNKIPGVSFSPENTSGTINQPAPWGVPGLPAFKLSHVNKPLFCWQDGGIAGWQHRYQIMSVFQWSVRIDYIKANMI